MFGYGSNIPIVALYEMIMALLKRFTKRPIVLAINTFIHLSSGM